jgi:hypothetical protein
MTKSLTSTIAAALIASATFGGAALAAGDYYEGASHDTVRHNQIDRTQTNSIGERDQRFIQAPAQHVNPGDYYEGANRPE